MKVIECKKNELQFLKNFKGILSISVLICHLWSILEGEPTARFLVNYISKEFSQKAAFYIDRFFVEIGGVAVWYFFIITGIGVRMSMEKKDNISYMRFVKRYTKLMIPVLLISLVSFGLMKCRLFACYFSNNTCLSEWTVSKNSFEPNFFEMLRLSIYGMWFTNEVNVYVTFTWCMSIFLWGAYVCYAIWGVSHSWETKHIITILVFLVFLLRDNNIVLCILGYMIADIFCRLKIDFDILKSPPKTLCVSLVVLFTIISSVINCNIYIRELLIFFSSCIIVFNADFFEQILSRKVLDFLGNISYEIYLIHYVVLFTVTSYIYQYFYQFGALLSEIISVIITIPIVLLCATLLSRGLNYFSIIKQRCEDKSL